MMNLLNVIIPVPINIDSGGVCGSLLEMWWLFLLVWFILINIPCIIYTYWKYIKIKKQFPSLGFSWHQIPTLMASNFCAFILITTVILLCQIAFWLYDIICCNTI